MQKFVEQVKKQVNEGPKVRPGLDPKALAQVLRLVWLCGAKETALRHRKKRTKTTSLSKSSRPWRGLCRHRRSLQVYLRVACPRLAYFCLCVGVDPKSILCQFFKAGVCEKGSKCKFSHDPNVERRAEKINLYADLRREKVPEGIQGGNVPCLW